jgi:hypothetical protein
MYQQDPIEGLAEDLNPERLLPPRVGGSAPNPPVHLEPTGGEGSLVEDEPARTLASFEIHGDVWVPTERQRSDLEPTGGEGSLVEDRPPFPLIRYAVHDSAA